jgi:hypothetical protein
VAGRQALLLPNPVQATQLKLYRWKYDKIREYNEIGNPFKAMNLHVMNDLHLYGNHFACISFLSCAPVYLHHNRDSTGKIELNNHSDPIIPDLCLHLSVSLYVSDCLCVCVSLSLSLCSNFVFCCKRV